MKYFFIDPSQNITKTYDELIYELNRKKIFNKYVYTRDIFEQWTTIFAALVYNFKIHLLDSEFSHLEIKNLGIGIDELSDDCHIRSIQFASYTDLLGRLKTFSENSNLIIYTSGTTGRPKKVALNLRVLRRNVKTGEKFKDHVWAFAYNPTHIAGLQVFFQAAFNQNTIINIFNTESNQIPNIFEEYHITHISATPTFYKKLLMGLSDKYLEVQRLTVGGERFDPMIEGSLRKYFPNAKIKNIYASTEAGTLFSSENEIFTISPEIAPMIRISDDGEIIIHKKLLGDFETENIQDEWYHSGDLVELISENSFRFISRKTEMINVGGYKVNPNEVEWEIKKVEGVIDVIVKPISNKITGNILVADICKYTDKSPEELENNIYKHLNIHLQPYKIPRIIRFVENISLTRSGKKDRQ